jgi:stress response protein YsnF
VSAGRVEVRVEQREDIARLALEAMAEHVEVERVAVGREVDRAEGPRQEGDVLVVPVYEEVVVVQRRLVLKEEIRLHRRATVRRWEEDVSLRRDEPVIERHPPPQDDASPGVGGKDDNPARKQ